MTKFRALLLAAITCLLATSAFPAQIEVPDWLATTRWGGDFRYRHETIDDEYFNDTRNRHRIRLRVWLKTSPNEHTTVGFRLASGGTSARSTNQTLSEGFSTKEFGLGRAYVELKLREALKLIAGKSSNPFATVSQLLWDSDVSPEGMTVITRLAPGGMTANIVAGGYWLQEFKVADDQGVLAIQGVLSGKNDDLAWEVAAGYFDFQNFQNGALITGPYGNTQLAGAPDGTPLPYYRYDYDILHFLGSAALTVAPKTQVAIYFEAVENTAISIGRHGVLGGVRFQQKGKLPWAVGYSYREVEADAVVASLIDSDFADGRSDATGHQVSMSVSPIEDLKLGATGILSETQYPAPEGKQDFIRLMLDIAVSF